jgi:hypothetical protein
MAEEEGKEILPLTNAPVEEDVGMSLGDTIVIFGGSLNGTVGKLYGFSIDRFSILPNGSTDRLTHISLLDGVPDPNLQIKQIVILKKAVMPGFVNLLDIHPEQYVETFDKDGNPGPIYKVKSVNEVQDSAVLIDETDAETTFHFGGTGISRDLPFEVMRMREGLIGPKGPPTQKDEKLEGLQRSEISEDKDDYGESQAEPLFFLDEREIELPVFEELHEKSSAEMVFPDVFQRSEMLSQLIRMLPEAQQKNPIQLKLVRRLVETMMNLRNQVVKYGETGDPMGIKPTSLQTLAQLIKQPNVSMIRKVVQMAKVIYLDTDKLYKKTLEDNDDRQNQITEPSYLDEEHHLFVNFHNKLIKKADDLQNEGELEFAEGIISELPRFYQHMEKYRQQIQQPYIPEQGETKTIQDEDVFRIVIPDSEEKPLLAQTKLTYFDEKGKEKPVDFYYEPHTTNIPFGTTRVLKERETRVGKESKVIEPAEAPAFTNVLIFPKSVARDIGPIRSGSLAKDISISMAPPQLLQDILKELGDIEDYPTADSILNLGLNGMLGNVLIKDWIEQQNLQLSGISDVYALLQGYGVNNLEWNQEQVQLFDKKIEEYLAALKIFLNKQREENASTLTNLKYEPQNLLTAEASARLEARVDAEPLLQKVIEQVREYMGELSKVDINWFSYVFLQYPDLVLAVLGQQAGVVARERNRFIIQQYLNAIRNAYKQKQLVDEAVPKPVVNTCPHVASLEACRRVAHKGKDEPSDVIKMKLLIKFLARFRGQTRDNWVWCNVCNKHLLCGHELLQIQEFARPREQEAIHKEILIKFSGGVFAGKNICRVCGQAISDLDFDTNLEFDDEGHPMMGRAVMEDNDIIEEKKVQDLLSGPAEVVEKMNFGSEIMNTMYETFKKLSGEIGINPTMNDYQQMVNQLNAYVNTLPSREEYKKRVDTAKKEGKQNDDAMKQLKNYDIIFATQYVAACVAILVLNVQSRIPDYTTYHTNSYCREGFFGYPLENEEKKTGLQCINTVAASINEKTFPWNMTPLQKSADVPKRAELLMKYVTPILEKLLTQGAVQLHLQQKREYRIGIYGKVGSEKYDKVDPTFRPIPYHISEEEAAKEAIVSAAATPEKAAVAWIRTAHGLIRREAVLDPKSPFAATTCCKTNVIAPGGFWMQEEVSTQLPPLEPRLLGEPPYRSTTLEPTFYTTKSEVLEGKLKESEYYKLFTKVCWQGERKGHPHEFGLTLTCSYCNLHLDKNPNLPLVDLPADSKDTKEQEKRMKEYHEKVQIAEAEVRANLQVQNVDISKEAFEDLLQSVQQKTFVKEEVLRIPLSREKIFTYLKKLPLHPLTDWVGKLNRLEIAMNEYGIDATTEDIATAANELIEEIKDKEKEIAQRLNSQKLFTVLQKIFRRPARECGEALRTFLLIPFMRWLSEVKADNFKILTMYELDKITQNDIMNRGLGNHLKSLGNGNSVKELKGIVERKVKAFLFELRIACAHVFPILRDGLTPGGRQMVLYLCRAYVIGIVHHLIDPLMIPPGDSEIEFGAAPNLTILYGALVQALGKFEGGSEVPSEDQIRTYLQLRAEEELQQFIQRQDKMTREQRQLERTKKNFGLGDWAIGNSKAIREYDPEMYERWRQERAAAGLQDYGPANEGKDGREYDALGYVTGEINENDAGYDIGENYVDD